ncbi:MAG: ATP-dependent DNA ligase Cdc17 [Paramarteilia canceri]
MLAKTTGDKSQGVKKTKINQLLLAGSSLEQKFLARILLNKLRIGLAEKTILISLAEAFFLSKNQYKPGESQDEMQQAVRTFKEVFNQCPSYEKVVSVLFENNFNQLLELCSITVGMPLQPMLAEAAHSIEEIMKKFKDQDAMCQFKYDGERAQVNIGLFN